MAEIGPGYHVFLGNRRKETGPSRARIEFGFRGKQRQAAADAKILAWLFLVIKRATKLALGASRAGDAELFIRELFSPLRFGLDHLGNRRWGAETPLSIKQTNNDSLGLHKRYG